MKKVIMKKEFPNPENITKRMNIKNKVKSITIKDGGMTMEVEFENEPTEDDQNNVIQYFKKNPYWEVVK